MGLITRIAGKPARSAASFRDGLRRLFSCHRQLCAAIGLGFLSQYEGLFIGILLPMFAGIALLANAIAGSIIDSGDARRSAR
jgi:mercuric ion transport protein